MNFNIQTQHVLQILSKMTSNINPGPQVLSRHPRFSWKMVNSSSQATRLHVVAVLPGAFQETQNLLINKNVKKTLFSTNLQFIPMFFEQLQFHCDSSLLSLAMFHIFQPTSNGGNSKTQISYCIQPGVNKDIVSKDGRSKETLQKTKSDLNEITCSKKQKPPLHLHLGPS